MNPYFRTFTESVLQKVEHRRGVALNYLRFPKIQNFAMIDTVISGRAANEILRAFDAIAGERCYASNPNPDAVKPYAFLIVDEDGKKLWPQFKRYLDERPKSLTERLPIPKIVSEDTGSSLLGVSAVVYPSLMEQSESFRYKGIEFFVGAGSWHIKDYGNNLFHFKQFMNMIYSGIDALSSAQDSPEKARFAKTRQDYLDLAENIGLLDLEDNDIACNQCLRTLSSNLDQTYLTNSNVFHVKFKPELTRKLGYEICNFPGVTCAAPEEGKEKPHVKKKRTLRKKK